MEEQRMRQESESRQATEASMKDESEKPETQPSSGTAASANDDQLLQNALAMSLGGGVSKCSLSFDNNMTIMFILRA